MDRFGPPTRLANLKQGPALVLIVLLLAGLIASAWPTSSAAPRGRTSIAEQSDPDLYRSIIGRVRAGDPYYPAVAEELRKDGYPMRPFLTFRLPTQAVIYAKVSEPVMFGVQIMLAIAVLLAWFRRLAPGAPLWLRAIVMPLLLAGVAGLLQPVTSLFHESWAALLRALAIAIRRPGHAAGAIVAGGIALMVRETALPMVVMMGGLALVDKRWREALGWAAAIGLFALYLGWHAHEVALVVQPTDPETPGWKSMLGLPFSLTAMAAVTAATILPVAVAAPVFLLSLFGWGSVREPWALRAALTIGGYEAMLALFARPDTFYWALLAAPLSLMGLAFLPAALRDLAGALDLAPRRVAGSAP